MFNKTKFDLANLERIERYGWQTIAEFDDAIRDWEVSLNTRPTLAERVRGFFKKKCTNLVPRLPNEALLPRR